MKTFHAEELLDASCLQSCRDVLKAGGILCYPTETFYALGADASNEEARNKVYNVKARSAEKELPCIAASREMVERLCDTSHPFFPLLAQRYWPGPLTMVLPLLSAAGTIAIRVSSSAIARQLSEALGGPIISTSANISGEPAVADPDQLSLRVTEALDILIDVGIVTGGEPSTVVSLAGDLRILRDGAIPAAAVLQTLRR